LPIIELNKIDFSYKNGVDNTFSLHDINLAIGKGEFVSIIGPNGSGKSTLMKIISNLLYKNSGEIFYNGEEYSSISKKEFARHVAYVPQALPTLYPFSVYDIVLMGRTPYLNFMGFESGKDSKIVNESLELLGISHLRNKGINNVSGGEAQRTFIARALAQKPEVLLLDEPNAHLDIEHQVSIFNLLRKLNLDEKLTIISVSHDLNLAGFYCEKAILMNEGRIVMNDLKHNILTEYNIKKYFGVEALVNYKKEENFVNVNIIPIN